MLLLLQFAPNLQHNTTLTVKKRKKHKGVLMQMETTAGAVNCGT
jgi:hypothetical protein